MEAKALDIVAFCGGRDKYFQRKEIQNTIDGLVKELGAGQFVVMHGDCTTGVDSIVDVYCVKKGIQPIRVPAMWEAYGKGAGPIRNGVMAQLKPIRLYAFQGGDGTADMVRQCEASGVPVMKVGWE